MKFNLSTFLSAAAVTATAVSFPAAVDAKPSACVVTTGADSGIGSLRDALTSCNLIRIRDAVGTITIQSTLLYGSTEKLELVGSGQTIQATDDFTLLEVSKGADLSVKKLTFAGIGGFGRGPTVAGSTLGDGKGIFVDVPKSRTGTVMVELQDVTVKDVAYHGIHISDCDEGDDCGGKSSGSDASVEVVANGLTIEDVGQGKHDADGLRVDERGPGDIKFDCKNAEITGAGADGIELDEAGPGDVIVIIKDSTIINNGNWCFGLETFGEFPECDDDGEPDVDDGFDIDESDEGSLYITATNVIISDNFDEGFDLDESGPGGIVAEFTEVTANDNKDEGIKCSEEDDGGLSAVVKSCTVNGSKENDGMQFESEGEGRVTVVIKDTTSVDNDGKDVKVEQPDDSTQPGTLEIRNSLIGSIKLDNIIEV